MKQTGICAVSCNKVCKVKEVPACELLESLGIEAGSTFCVKQKSPWKGPVVVEMKGRRELAIDYSIASQFVVEEVDDSVLQQQKS
ncbi:FeoA family protein [Salisediminibacterium halotolerans]|uniref:Ferrous iron transport protein A n=1 Tax=Salisediminibacterium halotolerans TaxID=517425 RepID=A0A1H9TAF8_9BACI|nr:FeoA family protein [Salisediminibacterium haloalkalitolerans]SER94235.1 ferrous iron transport protein A [Salisediminibacterium haloalkalitolerans]